jgi:uncharacterized membrane protein
VARAARAARAAGARKAARKPAAPAPPADETALDAGGLLRWGALAILALAGMGVAAYLTYTHYSDTPVTCLVGHGCQTVQQSEYSTIAGVPVALLGGLAAAALLAIALGRLSGLPLAVEWASLAVVGLTTVFVAFAAYLTYIELFVLDAICIYCVTLASIFATSWLISLADSFLTRDISPEPG